MSLTSRESAIIAYALYTLKLEEHQGIFNASQTEINDIAQKVIKGFQEDLAPNHNALTKNYEDYGMGTFPAH